MTSASTFSETADQQPPNNTGTSASSPPSPPPPESTEQAPEWASLPVKRPPLTDKCWLHREQPGTGQPYVLVSQGALRQIDEHGKSNLQAELGGALLGQAYRYEDKVFVEVLAALPAVSQDHGPVHFTFSADSWTQLHQDRAEQYPNLDIVGWFHTHPGLGVFYSSDDVVVHSAAFTLPWHVGLVVDPVIGEAGFFGWINNQLAPFSGFYELLDEQKDPITPWRVVRTAVWYDEFHEEDLKQPVGGVYMPANQRPSVLGVSPRLGFIVGAIGILLSIVLLLGWVVPLTGQVNLLEQTVLTLADEAPGRKKWTHLP